jgi:hypothetical protein
MLGRSSIWDSGRPLPRAAYPRFERSGPDLTAYLALLQLGVAVPRLSPAARWALTPPFHPYPPQWAVCFLWPFPSSLDAQALPGSLPCGARTFLDPSATGRDRHAPPTHRKISSQLRGVKPEAYRFRGSARAAEAGCDPCC